VPGNKLSFKQELNRSRMALNYTLQDINAVLWTLDCPTGYYFYNGDQLCNTDDVDVAATVSRYAFAMLFGSFT
jgi:hypothetical protein